MTEMALLGIGMLLMLCGWKFALRPAMLVTTRDQLFDLRDSVREEFVTNGRGLDDPAYLALRSLLNGYLRYIEDVTFFRLVGVVALQQEYREAFAGLHAETEKQLMTEDEDVNKYVLSIRKNALLKVLEYAVKTSPVALVLSVVVGLWLSLARCKDWCLSFFSGSTGWQKGALIHATAYSVLVFFSPSPSMKSRDIAQVVMEEQALHRVASI